MSPDRNTPVFTRHAGIGRIGRMVLCALIACAVTMLVWGAVGESAAQAAQRAVVEQSVNGGLVVAGKLVNAQPAARSTAQT